MSSPFCAKPKLFPNLKTGKDDPCRFDAGCTRLCESACGTRSVTDRKEAVKCGKMQPDVPKQTSNDLIFGWVRFFLTSALLRAWVGFRHYRCASRSGNRKKKMGHSAAIPECPTRYEKVLKIAFENLFRKKCTAASP